MALDAIPQTKSNSDKEAFQVQSSSFLELISLESDTAYAGQLAAIHGHVAWIEREFPVEFVFHGSFGDGRYIKGWSDFDMICSVGTDLIRDQAAFNEFRRSQSRLWELFKDACSFQHHFISFFLNDLKDAGQVLPVEALSPISSVNARNFSFFRHEANRAGTLKALKSRMKSCEQALIERVYKHHCIGNECLHIDLKPGASGMFQLFALLCHVMLLPALALTVAGRPVHKRQSFGYVDEIFSHEPAELIATLSSLRAEIGTIFVLNMNTIIKFLPA